MHHSLVIVGLDHIVDLENHLDDLGGQLDLLLLRGQCFIDLLVLHVVGTLR